MIILLALFYANCIEHLVKFIYFLLKYKQILAKFMIFLDKYTVKPRFPRNWAYPVVNIELTLCNRFTNKKHIFYDVLLDETPIYYILKDLDLKELDTGEYEYTLKDKTNLVVVSKGLIQIGPRESNSLQFNKKIEYIEYGK